MIVVMQCAGGKRDDAGHLTTRAGVPVTFVADPGRAPAAAHGLYARPDDPSDTGASWRDILLAYNRDPGGNPLGLLPAFQVYKNDIYRRLVRDERFGLEKTFILSAGWGLLDAAFLTPSYDVTFSTAADAFKRRKKNDRYRDLCLLPDGLDEPVVAFCSKEYLPLFCRLTQSVRGQRTVFYNSAVAPAAPGCVLRKFDKATRATNWQYDCANAFLDGDISL